MATLVKEKHKQKKKSKEKKPKISTIENVQEIADINEEPVINISKDNPHTNIAEDILQSIPDIETTSSVANESKNIEYVIEVACGTSPLEAPHDISEQTLQHEETRVLELDSNDIESNFKNLSSKLQRMAIPESYQELSDKRKGELENVDAYLASTESLCVAEENVKEFESEQLNRKDVETIQELQVTETMEVVQPSAPMLLEENIQLPQSSVCQPQTEVTVEPLKPKTKCMPIEEAIWWFGGKEMSEVQSLSEREEALVEAGPMSGPDHPLVDLLSTFRSSLIAVERQRNELIHKMAEEERYRNELWQVERLNINISEPCPCGGRVYFKGSYEHAVLLRDKLPVAKMRLESLLRDVQDSYSHYQHEALLAHCQIEELISETISASKAEIREALSLILQALRLSDTAPEALSSALQRWASALSQALVDGRDLRQLLFLIHQLFRQTHSVKWASSFIQLNVEDSVAAARIIALLEILLARPKPHLEAAVECTEETEEVWEEVDKHGGGGAVSEGTLRERDLLALLSAFPLQDLVARLLLFTHADLRQARAASWCGARGTLRACCGVRALLHALRRASHVHARYHRLRRALRALATAALVGLAGLHLCSRDYYNEDHKAKISAELEACFTGGLALFGTEELYSLPATLLGEDTAMDYCVTLGTPLHDKSPKRIESLGVDIPFVSCEMRVRMVTQAAVDRTDHHQLARTVLDFLYATCLGRKSMQCVGACAVCARASLPRLLAAHTHLYPVALHALADLHQVEPVEPWAVSALSVGSWRPRSTELRALLDDWLARCEHLIQHLLLNLDYTPHTGLSLDTQLSLGAWLCTWGSGGEARWRVLRRLRVHRTAWGAELDAPPPDPPPDPEDIFATAYALLSSAWGHCIPLLCSRGVEAWRAVCAGRVRAGVHCAAPLMCVMAQSPESVSLTPQFGEVLSALLTTGPTLMQRALGRAAETGYDMLLRTVLLQFEDRRLCTLRPGLLSAWAHALWGRSVCGGGGGAQGVQLLDVAALATRDWPLIDAHAAALLQEDNSKEQMNQSVKLSYCAPLLCEAMLRAWHGRSSRAHHAALLHALQRQADRNTKINVDRALQLIDAKITSEELTIYRTANAALAAPLHHPSHLTLWRLFMHLYLERPPGHMQETMPVGPMFFSGIIKYRTLGHIKKRLTDTVTYHCMEVGKLKSEQHVASTSESTNIKEETPVMTDDGLFPPLNIVDFTGESTQIDSLSDEEINAVKDDKNKEDNSESNKKKQQDLMNYHIGAEKMIREYLRLIEEGEKVRALQYHVDIARFIPEQALEAGWQAALARSRPPPPTDDDSPATPPPPVVPPAPSTTPFNMAVNAILNINDKSRKRPREVNVKSVLENMNFRDSRTLFCLVDKCMKEMEALAKEWTADVSQISALDNKLWELVNVLRVRRSLPPVRRQCPNKCKPVVIIIPHQEWCISTSAENGIRENRARWLRCVRRVGRARPHAARTAAALLALARRIGDGATAALVAERVWRSAAPAEGCSLATHALDDTVRRLAERWLCRDGVVAGALAARWARGARGAAQAAQVCALVAPRLLPRAHWPHVYVTVLNAPLPDHLLFSCLSKFEMSKWSVDAGPEERREVVEALSAASQRWGARPAEHQRAAAELLAVHAAALLSPRDLPAHLHRTAHAAQRHALPPDHLQHVVKAAERCAGDMSFDQLGHLLRELGMSWWECRKEGASDDVTDTYGEYAPHVAQLFHVLLRALVRAAIALSYEPARVGRYIWSGVQESFGPWVTPHASLRPLLPLAHPRDDAYTPMLDRLVVTIQQLMDDCPGSEEVVLQQVWEWCVSMCAGVRVAQGTWGAAGVGGAGQAAALLAHIARLPWRHHQWCYGDVLNTVMQMSTLEDPEIQSWCCESWSKVRAETWLRRADEKEQIEGRLLKLLYLFTGCTMPHTPETLEEATRLPWSLLPDHAIDQGLDYFFSLHHNAGKAYYELPQFHVVLYACGLRICPDGMPAGCTGGGGGRRSVRGAVVSRLVRACAAPSLLKHVPSDTDSILKTITHLAPHIENSEGELEDLLSRAIIIMCMDPAAAAALPVWEHWMAGISGRLSLAALSACGTVTALQYFAPLAELAARNVLQQQELRGWEEVRTRWISSPWRRPCELVGRGSLRAAYGCALVADAEGHQHRRLTDTLQAFSEGEFHFIEQEVMVAVWICYVVRACGECAGAGECAGGCAALLGRWAEPARRSLLRVVTLQPDHDRPTAGHRLLCRLAQCILSPSESSARAYESACAAMGSTYSDVAEWGAAPAPDSLPRLAARLYPKYNMYFDRELNLVNN